MCGIGGFSLSPKSKINVKKLAKALMCELEQRGNQASGYAWSIGRQSGMYKKDVPGSKLRLYGLPRSAQNVILHTRLATHGSVTIQENNHPVLSPKNNIMLVHNGVIWNHQMIKKELGGSMPEVDTAVIPALLEREGKQGLAKIDGDAAVAWLDERNAGKLHIARIEHSPIVVCQTTDGSFIFASTLAILENAVKKLGIEIEWTFDMKERTAITVVGGTIVESEVLPEMLPEYEEFSNINYGKYRSMTSGISMRDYDYVSGTSYDYDWNEKTEDMKFGWNQIGNTWKWYDGNKVTLVEYEDDEGNVVDQEFIDYDSNSIITFEDFKARFEEFDGHYYDSTYTLIGDEDDLWDEYELFRYDQMWQEKEEKQAEEYYWLDQEREDKDE